MIFFGFFTIQFNSFVCKLVEMLGQLSNIMRIHWIGYLEYNSICLLVGIGTPPPPLPKASVSLPQNQRGWEHSQLKNRNLDLKSPNDAANKINFKKRNAASNSPRFAYSSGHCLSLQGWKRKYVHKIKDDRKIKREKNIDRRGPRQIGTDCHIPDPPTFWLPTTFN